MIIIKIREKTSCFIKTTYIHFFVSVAFLWNSIPEDIWHEVRLNISDLVYFNVIV